MRGASSLRGKLQNVDAPKWEFFKRTIGRLSYLRTITINNGGKPRVCIAQRVITYNNYKHDNDWHQYE